MSKLLTTPSSYDILNYCPVPQEKCEYNKYNLPTKNTIIGPEKKVTPLISDICSTSQICDGSVSKITVSSVQNKYLPKFYIEYSESKNSHEVEITQNQIPEIKKLSLWEQNSSFIEIPLHQLIPKGEKIQITENVLRSVFKKHSEDLPTYLEKNVRHANYNISAEAVEKVATLLEPIFFKELNLMNLIKLSHNLLEHDYLEILKGVIKALYKAAGQTSNSQYQWMLDKVPYVPGDRSPVHPRILAVSSLLTLIIDEIVKVKKSQDKGILMEKTLSYMELVFYGVTEFNNSQATFWLQMGYLYTTFARLMGSLVRVRQLMYDLLYCFPRRSLTVSFAMLKTWSDVLYKRPSIEDYYDDPLAVVIILCLTTVPLERVETFKLCSHKHIIHRLHTLMTKMYQCQVRNIRMEELPELLLERLSQPGVIEGIILLSKRNLLPIKKLFEKLIKVVEEWHMDKCENTGVRAVAAIKAVCSSLRAYDYSDCEVELQRLFKLFKEILIDDGTPKWMQEVIIVNACNLARISHQLCMDLVDYWKPTEISMDVVDHILLTVIQSKSRNWWSHNRVALAYLNTI